MVGRSYGFRPDGYDQIIVFDNEGDFKEIVAANPGMTAIMGADDHTRQEFPGVFIAGLKELNYGQALIMLKDAQSYVKHASLKNRI